VGPRVGLDAVERKNTIITPAGNLTLVVQPVAWSILTELQRLIDGPVEKRGGMISTYGRALELVDGV
jgi:hypothetical protein